MQVAYKASKNSQPNVASVWEFVHAGVSDGIGCPAIVNLPDAFARLVEWLCHSGKVSIDDLNRIMPALSQMQGREAIRFVTEDKVEREKQEKNDAVSSSQCTNAAGHDFISRVGPPYKCIYCGLNTSFASDSMNHAWKRLAEEHMPGPVFKAYMTTLSHPASCKCRECAVVDAWTQQLKKSVDYAVDAFRMIATTGRFAQAAKSGTEDSTPILAPPKRKNAAATRRNPLATAIRPVGYTGEAVRDDAVPPANEYEPDPRPRPVTMMPPLQAAGQAVALMNEHRDTSPRPPLHKPAFVKEPPPKTISGEALADFLADLRKDIYELLPLVNRVRTPLEQSLAKRADALRDTVIPIILTKTNNPLVNAGVNDVVS